MASLFEVMGIWRARFEGGGGSLGEAFDAVDCEEDMACFLLSMKHRTLASDIGAMFEDL